MKPGVKPTRWTADDKARVADLTKRGFTQQEIASVLGTSQQTVSRLARTIVTETEARESATWESACADPAAFMATFPSSLKALRAIGQLDESHGAAHRSDHPHDEQGQPAKGHKGRCDAMWDKHVSERDALYAAYDAHSWH